MRHRRRGTSVLAALPVALAVLGVLVSLWSCNNSDAQTAANLQIDTFTINPSSLLIRTDNTAETAPEITVDGDTTTYRIRSDGFLSFTEAGGTLRTFDLDPEDMIIERPLAGLLTFIRQQ